MVFAAPESEALDGCGPLMWSPNGGTRATRATTLADSNCSVLPTVMITAAIQLFHFVNDGLRSVTHWTTFEISTERLSENRCG